MSSDPRDDLSSIYVIATDFRFMSAPDAALGLQVLTSQGQSVLIEFRGPLAAGLFHKLKEHLQEYPDLLAADDPVKH